MHYIIMWVKDLPECLYLSLESLSRCRGIENYHIYFSVGQGYDPEVLKIIEHFSFSQHYGLYFSKYPGLDHDVGEAMKAVALDTDDYFVIVGGDIAVSADFLEVMEYCAENFTRLYPELFIVSARGIRLTRTYNDSDIPMLRLSQNLSMGAGMVFTSPFKKYCQKYFNEEYYSGIHFSNGITDYSTDFFYKYFPEFPKRDLAADGLLARLIKRHELNVLTTVVPRCQETGFYGVHKQQVRLAYYSDIYPLALEQRVLWMKDKLAKGTLGNYFPEFCRGDFFEMKPDHKWQELKIAKEIK